MKFDLKTPCKNCPFRSDDTRITFATRGRAEEIAESAYRNGFPCHLSANHIEEDEHLGIEGGYVFGKDTQHCAGAIIMFIKDGHDCTPGTGNDEDLFERLRVQMDFNAPVFDSESEFIAANPSPRDRKRKRA